MRLLTKLIFIIIGILITAGLSGCKEKEPLPPQMTGQSLGDDSDTISTGYVNEISAADVWIIPDIKENHKKKTFYNPVPFTNFCYIWKIKTILQI